MTVNDTKVSMPEDEIIKVGSPPEPKPQPIPQPVPQPVPSPEPVRETQPAPTGKHIHVHATENIGSKDK